MKKILSLLLTMIILTGIISGCTKESVKPPVGTLAENTVFEGEYILTHDETLTIPAGITAEFAQDCLTQFDGQVYVYGSVIFHNTTWQDFIDLKDGTFHFYKGANLYIDDTHVLGDMGDYSSQILLGNPIWKAQKEGSPVLSVDAENVNVFGKVYLNATISDLRPWNLGADSAVVLYSDNALRFVTDDVSFANVYTYGGVNTHARCTFNQLNYNYSYDGEQWWGFGYANLADIPNLLTLAGYYSRVGQRISEYRGGTPIWNGATITQEYVSSTGEDGEIIKDIEYADREGTRNTYDLWIPAGLEQGQDVPVILFLHGGSWNSGEKESMAELCAMYAKLGYVTATMNYRLANEQLAAIDNGNFFDMNQDVWDTVTSIRAELEARGYHSTGMAVSGQSAGGYLAMLYATTHWEDSPIPVKLVLDEYGPSDLSPEAWANSRMFWAADKWTDWAKEYNSFDDDPKKDEKLKNAAAFVVGMLELHGYPRYEVDAFLAEYQDPQSAIYEQLASISPLLLWEDCPVPCVGIHGEMDPIVSVANAQRLKARLTELGVDNYIIISPVSHHTNGEDATAYLDFYAKSLEYLQKYLPAAN